MQSNVRPFFSLNVDGSLSFEFLFRLPLAILDHHHLDFAGNQVVCWAGRNTQSKLTTMVRKSLPIRLFLPNWVNFNSHAIQRLVIGTVSGPENQSVMFCKVLVFTGKQQRLGKKRD